MNIIEVKNNLVKLTYDENISLASFIKIIDLASTYIAQIIHLESTRKGKIAIAKIIFNYKGAILAYDGSVPSIQAEVIPITDEFFIDNLDKDEPLLIGKTIEGGVDVLISSKLLKDKPIICAEKFYQSVQLLENIINQNEQNSRKTVVIDITGNVKGNKIVATKDFKIPLDKDSLDYIFDRGFEDLTKENKAFIQDIFSELSDYIQTVEYIPFKDFNAVIEYEFKRSQQLQLIILKNRLLQFEKKGIFAQDAKEFKILDEKLKSDNTLVIDLSKLSDSLQIEYINYIYAQMEKQSANFYSLVMLNNNNSSKTTLNTIFGAKNIFTSIVCSYSYNYINELKQCSKNMFMFTPLKQQNDFGAYNIYLNKLAEDEFILYGKSTKFIPLIIQLEKIEDFSKVVVESKEEIVETPSCSVDKKEEVISELNDGPEINTIEEDIVIVEDNQQVESAESGQDTVEEVVIIEEKELLKEEVVVEETISVDEQTIVIEENIEKQEFENPDFVEVEEEKSIQVENIQEQESTEIFEESQTITEEVTELNQDFSDISIDIEDNEIAEAIENRNEVDDLLKQIQKDSSIKPMNVEDLAPVQMVEKSDIEIIEDDVPAQNSVNELQEADEELTDDDLDLIESLSDDEEKIEIIEDEKVEVLNDEKNEETEQKNIIDNNEKSEEKPISKSITDEILEEENRKRAEEEANRPDPIEEQIEKPSTPPPVNKKMETRAGVTPIVPVYSAEIPDEDIVESDNLVQGDQVVHSEFGKGVVEKMINYGDRVLCSINFEEVGRRLLDPKISELKKV